MNYKERQEKIASGIFIASCATAVAGMALAGIAYGVAKQKYYACQIPSDIESQPQAIKDRLLKESGMYTPVQNPLKQVLSLNLNRIIGNKS